MQKIRSHPGGCLLALVASLLFPFTPPPLVAAGPYEVDPATLQLWHFEENEGTVTGDAVGGRKADLVGGASWTKGKFGNAVKLDGTDDKIVMQEGEGWIPFGPKESFTVEAWIKVFKQGATQQIISCTPHYEMEVRPENGGVSFNMRARDGIAYVRCTGQTDVTDGKWHHIATVRDGNREKLILYVDGLVDAETPDSTAGSEVGLHRHAVFGGRGSDDVENLGGIIDEVRVSRGIRRFGNDPK